MRLSSSCLVTFPLIPLFLLAPHIAAIQSVKGVFSPLPITDNSFVSLVSSAFWSAVNDMENLNNNNNNGMSLTQLLQRSKQILVITSMLCIVQAYTINHKQNI